MSLAHPIRWAAAVIITLDAHTAEVQRQHHHRPATTTDCGQEILPGRRPRGCSLAGAWQHRATGLLCFPDRAGAQEVSASSLC
ncbi:MAG: hypothetical protein WBV74_21565 [Pseudonocardiaceae bacterium]